MSGGHQPEGYSTVSGVRDPGGDHLVDRDPRGRMTRQVAGVLRLEGFAALGLAVAAYASLGSSWLLFALVLLVPDVSMLGYLKDPRVGALTYNAVHTYAGPAMLGAVGWAGSYELAGAIALIWAAHIGLDRMLGFGLKYPSAFGDTHLGTGRG